MVKTEYSVGKKLSEIVPDDFLTVLSLNGEKIERGYVPKEGDCIRSHR